MNSISDTHDPADAPTVYCGLGRRLLCIIYDALILLGLLFLAGVAALPVSGDAQAFKSIPYTMYLAAVVFTYLGWCWTHSGQTLGMRAWHVRVVDVQGQGIAWKTAAVRYVVAIVSAGCVGLGFLWGLFRKDHCCWHDLASKTRLVRTDRN